VPAIMTHGVHGLLAPVNDHQTLARQVLGLLEDPPAARRLANTALASVQGCTWTAVRDQWLRAYQSTLADAAARQVAKNFPDPISPQ
jgi:hypothetical protein